MAEVQTRIDAPPRQVSLLVLLHMGLSGPIALAGWLFLWVGLIFTMIFVGQSHAVDAFQWLGATGTTSGVIVEAKATNMSENDNTVMAYTIEYRVGRIPYSRINYGFSGVVGREVEVEYPLANPAFGVAEGMRSQPFGAAVLFVLIFPLIGLLLAIWPLRKGWRGYTMLRNGKVAEAVFVAEKDTNVTINNMPQMARYYQFTVDGQTYQAKSLSIDVNLRVRQAGATELVLYHPDNPARNIVVADYRSTTRFDPHGHLVQPAWTRVAAVCILPALSIATVVIGCLLI